MSRVAADAGRLVYVGNLPDDIREREVEDLFSKYGRIHSVELKTPSRPPAFAFVEFDSSRDASDAVHGRDGYDFYGSRLRVELAKGSRPAREGPGPARGGRGGGQGGSQWRVLVHHLPSSASWQDLKDHFRKIVTPSFTNVFRERGAAVGVVEFDSRDDMDYAIRKLDDTEFRNPFERAYIRLKVDRQAQGGGGGGRGRSRSRSLDRSVDRSRGRSASRERSPSRGRSPGARSRSRSPSRGRSPGAGDGSRSPARPRSRSRSPSRGRSPASPARSRSRSPAPGGKSPRRVRSRSRSRSASPAAERGPEAARSRSPEAKE